ncbi:hypothetical protein [Curtobacterium sp. MCSS17_007]|uniref:hypothetical protein n=1 Tax=Curtobacterium sp. MCSS17_007 TaxID=2175646 RepID=UPI000DA8DF3F|nr:hypothetical protein [Curtobacterium sp. MCSS17_007]WIE76543.1 hypothetical protein DEJ22_004565 [Curtobacterium sp. MCSS17_007]
MSLFALWPRFGFSANPYSQETLQADATGDTLIAGRDVDIANLQMRIGSGGAHASVEGPIGAGKTSMINVAVYRMADACMKAKSGELFLPAVSALQPRQDVEAFVDDLFRVLAQTLIQYRGSFRQVGLPEPDTKAVDKWLNSAQYESWSGGGQAFGMGIDMGEGSEPNTSEGFTRSGFETSVRNELARVFGSGKGAIVCVLDNLEILESSGKARATLDELRDRVFNIPGVRWVLCGSRGIVSRARTQRLSGVIQAPTIVGPLEDGAAVDAVGRRIDYYGEEGATAPVTPTGFEFIYQALHRNLRDSMERAQEFSNWLAEHYLNAGQPLPSEEDRDRLVESWLLEQAEHAYEDARGVQPRVWQFFTDLARQTAGRAGSGEYEAYGFNNQQQLTASVTALADVNLVAREIDPDNGSRTINSITPLGWLVFFYKDRFESIAKL